MNNEKEQLLKLPEDYYEGSKKEVYTPVSEEANDKHEKK